MRLFRIAVLSDQHIDVEVEPESWDLARAAFRAALNEAADHVVLLGDTFDCATAMLRDAPKVRTYLKRLGLWHRDRLTIVPGNHDLFHTPHRGTGAEKRRELLRVPRASRSANYGAFCDWVDDLIDWDDLLDADEARFPHRKELGHVQLFAVDTNSESVLEAGNGFWGAELHHSIREAAASSPRRGIVAGHHPPFKDRLQKLADLLPGGYFPFGFPPDDFSRLKKTLKDAAIEVFLCGHIHRNGDEPYEWRVGNTDAFMVGRTGGVHGVEPIVGILDVPPRGRVRWSELAIGTKRTTLRPSGWKS